MEVCLACLGSQEPRELIDNAVSIQLREPSVLRKGSDKSICLFVQVLHDVVLAFCKVVISVAVEHH